MGGIPGWVLVPGLWGVWWGLIYLVYRDWTRGQRVASPEGELWLVRRVLLLLKDPPSQNESAEGKAESSNRRGTLVIAAVAAVVSGLVALSIRYEWGLVELALIAFYVLAGAVLVGVPAASAVWLLAGVLHLRAWTVEAVSEHPKWTARRWKMRGWLATRRAIKEIAQAIELGREPQLRDAESVVVEAGGENTGG